MALYEICPNCGAALDIGEKCDCKALNLDDDFGIVLDKGEMFLKATKEVSEYLETLPITKKQNNKLVALMVENIGEARKDAYLQGFQMGQDFQEYCNLFHGGNENEHKH